MDFEKISITKELAGLLNSAVASNRLPHAIVLEGSGEGDRLALARLLAKVQVCSSEAARPCGMCGNCIKAASGFHADISEAIAEHNDKEPLKVDAIREIRSDAYVYPNEAKRKVFILHNMQFCNEQSQNALLKVLEEPPEYVCFILTCPASTVLLSTILSRCSVLNMGPLISDASEKKQTKAVEAAKKISSAIVSPNEFDLMRETGVFEKDNDLISIALVQLGLIFRDALVIRQQPRASLLSAAADEAKQLSRALTIQQLFALSEAVKDLDTEVAANGNNNLLVTRLCSLLRSAAGK